MRIFRLLPAAFIFFFAVVAIACNLPLPILSSNTPTPATIVPKTTNTPVPPPTPTPTSSPTPVPEIRVGIAEEALELGDWQTAAKEFTAALGESGSDRTNYSASLGQAKTAFLEGNYATAIEIAEPLILGVNETQNLSDLISATFFLLGQAYNNIERYQEAEEAYSNYLELNPGLIDGYIHDLRGDTFFAEGDYLNAVTAYDNAIQSPGLFDRTYVEMKKARSFSLDGDSYSAIALYDEIYQNTENENTKALIHLRKGQIFTEIGQNEKAYNEYKITVENYPTAYESYSALLELVEAGVVVDDLNRGLVDFFVGEYGVALAAFDRYLTGSPSDPGTALYYSGFAHRYGGRYDDALHAWEKLIQNYPDHPYWDDAWEQKGFTQWFYLEDYTAAIKTLLDFVEIAPSHERATEFLDDAARVSERSGDLSQAADLWKKLTMDYPFDERASNSLFLSSISHYRLGEYDEALQGFTGTLGISKTLSDRSRALFWIGKTHLRLDNETEAIKAWQESASVDPTGYYSERALDFLQNREPFTYTGIVDFAYDQQSELSRAEAWLRTSFNLPDEPGLDGLGLLENEPALLRADELWRLGLQEEARVEYEALRQAVISDPELSFRLSRHLADIGMHRSAAFAARNVLDLAGMNDATSLTAPPLFSRIRFPILYTDIIIPIAKEYNIHPLLVLSLIRQESLFESFVQSSASAKGLMQIIPSTGMEITESLGWPELYTNSDLNRPLVNITFGIYYLAQQIDNFDGNIFAALAAYNGGPGNSAQWLSLAPDDPDLFLEVIRYSETRLYIRRIYEIFSIYRRLYDRTP